MVLNFRTQLSAELPEFGKLPRGAQVFVFENERAVPVYDNYSVYPDPEASGWRLEVYGRTTGLRFDRVCTKGGRYGGRAEALAEIDRFRYRGRGLVFFLIPVGFSYDKLEHIWLGKLDDCGKASYDEQRFEARRRLFAITEHIPAGETDLRARKIRCGVLEAFCKDEIAAGRELFPFALVSGTALLYVSGDKSQWQCERSLICESYSGEYGSYDGIAPAFVYDCWTDESVYGDIAFRKRGRRLCRVR